MRRYLYTIRALSTGALTLGILQAFGGINFSSIWASFLSTIFSLLAALFFGALGGPIA